jgi:broad specificity phosphatase PhoE
LLWDLDRINPGQRVLIVAHDAVILLFRYICEEMTEEDVLELTVRTTVRNASVTYLVRPSGEGRWRAEAFNVESHLREHGAPVTEHSGDADVLPR